MGGDVAALMRRLAAPVCALAISIGAAGPALADKLIVFKNGRTMRAKVVNEEKGWTRLELDGGNVVGFRTALVLSIEETSGSPAKIELPNLAAAGGGGGAAYASGSSPAYASRTADAQLEEPQAAADEPQQQAPPPPTSPGVTIGGGVPGIPASLPTGTGMRRLQRSGLNFGNTTPKESLTNQNGQPMGRKQTGVRGRSSNEDDEDE